MRLRVKDMAWREWHVREHRREREEQEKECFSFCEIFIVKSKLIFVFQVTETSEEHRGVVIVSDACAPSN